MVVTAARRGRGVAGDGLPLPGARHRWPPALVLPLAVPTYIVAYVYVELLEPLGPVQSGAPGRWSATARGRITGFPRSARCRAPSCILGVVLYPYVYMTARALFAVQSANLLEAARTLGAGPLETFRTVALPLARPALALGLSLALLETLNDIGASDYLGVRTLTVSIYTTWLNRGSLDGRGADRLRDAGARRRHPRGWRRAPGAAALRRLGQAAPPGLAAAALAALRVGCDGLACALPIAVGFLVPVAFLAREAIVRTLRSGVPPRFRRRSSAPPRAGRDGDGHRRRAGRAASPPPCASCAGPRVAMLARIAALGYAVPGTVLAVGLLWPLAAVDNAIANAWRGTDRRLARPDPDGLGRGRGHRLRRPLPRHRLRRDRERHEPHLPPHRRCRAHARSPAGRGAPGDPPAAGAARAGLGGAAGLRRRHEGAARDAAAAPAQHRYAGDGCLTPRPRAASSRRARWPRWPSSPSASCRSSR